MPFIYDGIECPNCGAMVESGGVCRWCDHENTKGDQSDAGSEEKVSTDQATQGYASQWVDLGGSD